ncbi:MAG TPA: hypothetical protein VEX86_10155 [Longimicrobium sp.]|nr:hypothetical protein [Longimicrobium sp.]
MLLTQDFRDVLSELSNAQADFLVIGAWAMSAYQMRRATGDLDIWVRPSAENAQRVWDALARFGAPLMTYKITLEELAKPGLVFQIGNEPDRIDILTGVDGLGFEEAWRTREYHQIEGVMVPVLSVPNLVKNKKASGRPQDLFDVQWMERKFGPGGTGL